VIVIKIADHNDRRYRKGMASIVRRIRSEATIRSIPIDPVTTKSVRNTLSGIVKNKEHIAGVVVRIFPSLGWKMPPTRERRPWVSEGWNMVIFDAVAIGLAYLENSPVDMPSS
jgi:hypothetical protein